MLAIWSLVPLPFLKPAWTSGSSRFTYCLENFEHYFTSMWDECDCDGFELWCWRRLLRIPWTARRSNQSILKEISPGISLEGMMLKLKLQYFGHFMWRVDSLEKSVMLGGIGGRRRRGRQEDEMAGWHHWLRGRESEWTLEVGDGQGGLACCDTWGLKEWNTSERLELNWTAFMFVCKLFDSLPFVLFIHLFT